MHDIILWSTTGFVVATFFASFFEWTLHKYFMHRPLGNFTYPYERHALIHHRIFKADETYLLRREEDKKTIPMAWWNGPALVLVGSIPLVAYSWISGHWFFLCGAIPACVAYYSTYEYLHWCMHLPKRRYVERSGIFFRLNGHHLLHHRYMHKNYNVVMPLADLMLGTLLLRSKVHFKQAQGPSIPNVQPRAKAAVTRPPEPVAK